MEIKTKFNIGDTVYLISGKQIVSKEITRIEINIEKEVYRFNIPIIRYYLGNWCEEEKYCFASKQELIDSL